MGLFALASEFALCPKESPDTTLRYFFGQVYTTNFFQHSYVNQECEEVLFLTDIAVPAEAHIIGAVTLSRLCFLMAQLVLFRVCLW